jgi:ABC-type multidrug transport system permease subunit
MYTMAQYFLSKNLIEIPELFIIPFIFIPIYYFMIGLGSEASTYFTHVLIFFLISFTGASMGLLIGGLMADPKDVSVVVPVAVLPSIVFSGFFKNRDDLPEWIGWVEYLSPNKYGFSAFAIN